MQDRGADWPVVAKKSGNADGAKGSGHSVMIENQPKGMNIENDKAL
jgi:hypothetical protein